MRGLPLLALAASLCVLLLSWTDAAPTPDASEEAVKIHEEKTPSEEVPSAPQPAEGEAATRVKRGGGGCNRCGGGGGGRGGRGGGTASFSQSSSQSSSSSSSYSGGGGGFGGGKYGHGK